MTWFHKLTQLTLCAGLGATLIACDSDSSKTAPAPTPPPAPAPLPEPAKREVFGVPLPPRVRAMSKNENYVWVETDMNISALEKYYRQALAGQDYEVIRVNATLRIVGLRPFMAVVKAAYIRGPRTYVRMIFMPARTVEDRREAAKIAQGDDADAKQARRAREAAAAALPSETPGSPVMLKTSSGELLAPGAKWGEPYYPPKNSPLDTPAMKHNWGKPFGQWMPH